eukprot:SAG11_NODE_1826_length_4202_cov_24.651231_2_plen_112_part_00
MCGVLLGDGDVAVVGDDAVDAAVRRWPFFFFFSALPKFCLKFRSIYHRPRYNAKFTTKFSIWLLNNTYLLKFVVSINFLKKIFIFFFFNKIFWIIWFDTKFSIWLLIIHLY